MADNIPFDNAAALAELEHALTPPPEEIVIKGKKLTLATAKRVGKIGGLKVSIFAKEHPPPHVCVEYQGKSANYQISDGQRITNGLERFDRHVIPWLAAHKDELIATWDATRPTNCPVGKYREPSKSDAFEEPTQE